MKTNSIFLIVFLLLFACTAHDIEQPEISGNEIEKHVKFLSSDNLQGRKPGTRHSGIACGYIHKQLKLSDLGMLEDDGLQSFNLVSSVKCGEKNRLESKEKKFVINKDYIPLAFSANKKLNANVVFVGYGFQIDSDSLKWDDYAPIDVKDKWVMILRSEPDSKNPMSPFAQYADLYSKVITATDNGAAGVFFVSPVGFNENDDLIKLRFDRLMSKVQIPAIHIKRTVADFILKETEKTIEQLEKQINETRQPQSNFCIFQVSAEVELENEEITANNVVALLESEHPQKIDEYILVGAHYDHLGFGGEGSGSRMPKSKAVHNGADDNASGVATLIEIAHKLSSMRDSLRRSVIFVAFDAEEMGLLGSKFFTENSPVELSKIKLMINLDMVGRMDSVTRFVSVNGTGTALESEDLLNKYNEKYKFDLNFTPEGYGPSDHAAFYAENIPVMFFSTGAHEDYHTPNDDYDKLNYKGNEELGKFICDLMLEVINRDKALTFQEAGPKERKSMRRGLKVKLSIMPAFGKTNIDGLGVDGVNKDGPAYVAGIKKGDIIKAINGEEIHNIYDYMNRLSKYKTGDNITIDIDRDGKKLVLLVKF